MVRTKKLINGTQSIQQARKELNVKGFVAINRGSLGNKYIKEQNKFINLWSTMSLRARSTLKLEEVQDVVLNQF